VSLDGIKRALLRGLLGAVALAALKGAWFASQRAEVDDERPDLVARRAYLVERVTAPEFGPRSFPEALGDPFRGEWAIVSLSMAALARRADDRATLRGFLDTAELAGFSVSWRGRRGYLLAPLVGAVALAAHRYPRSTEDINLAIGVHPDRLEEIAGELRREGFLVDVSLPDPTDPLGGVIRAQKQGIDRIEIVNFQNPPGGGFPARIEQALQEAKTLCCVWSPCLTSFSSSSTRGG